MTEEVVHLRYLLRPQEEANRPEFEVLSVYRDHGVIPKASRDDNFNKTPLDLTRYQVVKPGDLVINKMKAWQGSLGVSSYEGIVSPDYLVCTVDSRVYGPFLHYLLRSKPLIAEYGARSKGIRPAQWRLYWEDLADIKVTLPVSAEQRRIAEFLDAEVARIDRLALLHGRVVDRVVERERAFLDLEIDRLSARYGCLPFRRFILRVEQGVSPQCDNVEAVGGEWGVLKVSAVKGGQFHSGENKRLPDDLYPEHRFEVRDGDLLVTRANTPLLVGAVTVARNPRAQLLLCDKIFRVEVTSGLDKEFLSQMAAGSRVRALCGAASHGTSQSMANLKVGEIKEWPIPAVPLEEQRRVVGMMRESQARAAELRLAIERQLELLEERKRALVTAAVTGQMDVTTARGFRE
ncbi:hypothetical protein [Actinomadura mexicana]|uniref:Type I restriction enzyme, S subunit n=1 Tax=Actinomadura mexicana TaxID=134959 RepID=A0A238Y5D8_9ACTN|nr:hypothetical protein [Actinomadura mexicana]SNR66425.1 type I restriction enzyme, S subunit [Actinomadura mexicana]